MWVGVIIILFDVEKDNDEIRISERNRGKTVTDLRRIVKKKLTFVLAYDKLQTTVKVRVM